MLFGIFFGVNGNLGGGGKGWVRRDLTDSSGVFSRDIFSLSLFYLLVVFFGRILNKKEINQE